MMSKKMWLMFTTSKYYSQRKLVEVCYYTTHSSSHLLINQALFQHHKINNPTKPFGHAVSAKLSCNESILPSSTSKYLNMLPNDISWVVRSSSWLWLKSICSTRFRSEDLWVMSPTRFLCATEQMSKSLLYTRSNLQNTTWVATHSAHEVHIS